MVLHRFIVLCAIALVSARGDNLTNAPDKSRPPAAHDPSARQGTEDPDKDTEQLACLPSYRRDVRYFVEPSMNKVLEAIEERLASKRDYTIAVLKENEKAGFVPKIYFENTDAAQGFALLLNTDEEVRKKFSPEYVDRVLKDITRVTAHRPLATPRSTAAAISSVARVDGEFASEFRSPPYPRNKEGVDGLSAWREAVADPARLKAILEDLQFENGNQSYHQYFKLAMLKESILNRFEEESARRVRTEIKENRLGKSFEYPRPLTPAEALKQRIAERNEICRETAEKPSILGLVQNFVSKFHEDADRSHHGLPLEHRQRLNRLSPETQEHLEELMKDPTAGCEIGGEKLSYTATQKVAILYQVRDEAHWQHLIQQACLDLSKNPEAKVVKEDSKKEFEASAATRKERVDRIDELFKRGKKELSPAERESLELMEDKAFQRIDERLHALFDVGQLARMDLADEAQGKIQELFKSLTGGRAFVVDTDTSAYKAAEIGKDGELNIDPAKLSYFSLQSTNEEFSKETQEWQKANRKKILDYMMKTFDGDGADTGATMATRPEHLRTRKDVFDFFEKDFQNLYGQSLSKMFCTQARSCDDKYLGLSKAEKAMINRLLYVRSLQDQYPEVPKPSMLEGTASKHETALLDAHFSKATHASSPREQRQLRSMWRALQTEKEFAEKVWEESRSRVPNDPQMTQAAASHVRDLDAQQHMIEKHLYAPSVNVSNQKASALEKVTVEIKCPAANGKPERVLYRVPGVPKELLHQPEQYLKFVQNYLMERSKRLEIAKYGHILSQEQIQQKYSPDSKAKPQIIMSPEPSAEFGVLLYESMKGRTIKGEMEQIQGERRWQRAHKEFCEAPNYTDKELQDYIDYEVGAYLRMNPDLNSRQADVAVSRRNQHYDQEEFAEKVVRDFFSIAPHENASWKADADVFDSSPLGRKARKETETLTKLTWDLEKSGATKGKKIVDDIRRRVSDLKSKSDTPEGKAVFQSVVNYARSLPPEHLTRKLILREVDPPQFVDALTKDPKLAELYQLTSDDFKLRHHIRHDLGLESTLSDGEAKELIERDVNRQRAAQHFKALTHGELDEFHPQDPEWSIFKGWSWQKPKEPPPKTNEEKAKEAEEAAATADGVFTKSMHSTFLKPLMSAKTKEEEDYFFINDLNVDLKTLSDLAQKSTHVEDQIFEIEDARDYYLGELFKIGRFLSGECPPPTLDKPLQEILPSPKDVSYRSKLTRLSRGLTHIVTVLERSMGGADERDAGYHNAPASVTMMQRMMTIAEKPTDCELPRRDGSYYPTSDSDTYRERGWKRPFNPRASTRKMSPYTLGSYEGYLYNHRPANKTSERTGDDVIRDMRVSLNSYLHTAAEDGVKRSEWRAHDLKRWFGPKGGDGYPLSTSAMTIGRDFARGQIKVLDEYLKEKPTQRGWNGFTYPAPVEKLDTKFSEILPSTGDGEFYQKLEVVKDMLKSHADKFDEEIKSREHQAKENADPRPAFSGLSMKSANGLEALPPMLEIILKSVMKGSEKYGDFDKETQAKVIELIHNPWPSRILNLALQPKTSSMVADEMESLLKEEYERGLRYLNPDDAKLIQVLLGNSSDRNICTVMSAQPGTKICSFRGFAQRLANPKLSALEAEELRRWAGEQLVKRMGFPPSYSPEKRHELIKEAALRARSGRGAGSGSAFLKNMLALMVVMVDERGDNEKDVAAAQLEASKGGLVRFDPTLIASKIQWERKLLGAPDSYNFARDRYTAVSMPSSGGHPNNPILAKMLDEASKHGKGLSADRRLAILDESTKMFEDILASRDRFLVDLPKQGLKGVEDTFKQLLQYGNAETLARAKQTLDPNQHSFDQASQIELAKARSHLRTRFRVGDDLSEGDNDTLLTKLARDRLLKDWLPQMFSEIAARNGEEALKNAEQFLQQHAEKQLGVFKEKIREEIQEEAIGEEARLAESRLTEKYGNTKEAKVLANADVQRMLQNLHIAGEKDAKALGIADPKLLELLKDPDNRYFMKVTRKMVGRDYFDDVRSELQDEATRKKFIGDVRDSVIAKGSEAEIAQAENHAQEAIALVQEIMPHWESRIAAIRQREGEEYSDPSLSMPVETAFNDVMVSHGKGKSPEVIELARDYVSIRLRQKRNEGGAEAIAALNLAAASDVYTPESGNIETTGDKAWKEWQARLEKTMEDVNNSYQTKYRDLEKRSGQVENEMVEEIVSIRKNLHQVLLEKEMLMNRRKDLKEVMESKDWLDPDKITASQRELAKITLSKIDADLRTVLAQERVEQNRLLDLERRQNEHFEGKAKETKALWDEWAKYAAEKLQQNDQQYTKFINQHADASVPADLPATDRLKVVENRRIALQNYMDWRTRAEALGRLAPTADSLANDERMRTLVAEAGGHSRGFHLSEKVARQIAKDANDAELERIKGRDAILDELEKIGIMWNGLELDFSNMRYFPKGDQPKYAYLKDLLTRLGDKLSPAKKPMSMESLTLIPPKTPWEQFQDLIRSRWNSQGRPPMMEWSLPSEKNPDGVTIRVKAPKNPGEDYTFTFSSLTEDRKAAVLLSNELKKLRSEFSEELHKHVAHNNHYFAWDYWSKHEEQLGEKYNKYLRIADALKGFGNIQVVEAGQKFGVPASRLAAFREFERKTGILSEVDNTYKEIESNIYYRKLNHVITAATVVASIVTAPVSVELLAMKAFHSMSMAVYIHNFGAVLMRDAVPYSMQAMGKGDGEPMAGNWSEETPAMIKSALIFGAATTLAAPLQAYYQSARWAAAASEAGGVTGMATNALTSELGSRLLTAGLSNLGVNAANDFIVAAQNGTNFNLAASLDKHKWEAAQMTIYMSGYDSYLSSFMKGYLPKLAVSAGSNFVPGVGIAAWQNRGAREQLNQAEAAIKQKIASAPGRVEQEQAQIELKKIQLQKEKLDSTQYAGVLHEGLTALYFGHQGTKSATHIATRRELEKLANPGSEVTLDKIVDKLIEDPSITPPTQRLPRWLQPIANYALGYKDDAPVDAPAKREAAQGMMNHILAGEIPVPELTRIAQQAEQSPHLKPNNRGAPANEAYKIIASLAPGLGLSPRRLISGLKERATLPFGERPHALRALNSLNGVELKELKKTVNSQILREKEAAEKRGDRKKATELEVEYITLNPQEYRRIPISTLILNSHIGIPQGIEPGPGNGGSQVYATTDPVYTPIISIVAEKNKASPRQVHQFLRVYRPMPEPQPEPVPLHLQELYKNVTKRGLPTWERIETDLQRLTSNNPLARLELVAEGKLTQQEVVDLCGDVALVEMAAYYPVKVGKSKTMSTDFARRYLQARVKKPDLTIDAYWNSLLMPLGNPEAN